MSTVGVRLESEIQRGQLPARQESVLALALREAIANVVRHARATVCRVHVRKRAGAVILTISDDGLGGAPAEGNGLAGMRERVVASASASRVIILTTFARPGYLRRALEAGASGYVLKDAPSSRLADAIRPVHAGANIAEELRLTEGTVRNYLSEAISKVGGRNRVDAARIAKVKGWL